MAKVYKPFDLLNKKEKRERLKRLANPKKTVSARRNCIARFFSGERA